MSTSNDGGPAFPTTHQNKPGNILNGSQGMSLRAYIAVHRPAPEEIGLEFAGAVLGCKAPKSADFTVLEDYWRAYAKWETKAKAAYSVMQADALIAALNVPSQNIYFDQVQGDFSEFAEKIKQQTISAVFDAIQRNTAPVQP